MTSHSRAAIVRHNNQTVKRMNGAPADKTDWVSPKQLNQVDVHSSSESFFDQRHKEIVIKKQGQHKF